MTVGLLLVVTEFSVESLGVVPALPTAVRELGGLPLFGWAFSSFMLAWLVGTVGGGALADSRGPRLPMAFGLSAFAAGLLTAGVAQGMAPFLAGRVLQGAGGGMMIAAANVAVARGYPDHTRARIMALMASAWVLPALVGPTLSGAVAEWVGWRFVFVGLAPLTALAALLILAPLRSLDLSFDARRPLPRSGRVLMGLGAGLGAGLILAGASSSGSVGLVLGLLTVGALLLVPALGVLLPKGTAWARHGLPERVAARALLCFGFFGAEAFIPLATSELWGATPVAAGLALSGGALGWIAASWILARAEARIGARNRARSVVVGFVLLAVGIALVGAAILGSQPLFVVVIGWGIGGAGVGLAYTAGNLICLADAAPGQEGEVSGQLQVAEALAIAAGTGFGGALLAALLLNNIPPAHAHAAVFGVTFVVAMLGVAITIRGARLDATMVLGSPPPSS